MSQEIRSLKPLEDCMADYQSGSLADFEAIYARAAPRARAWLRLRVKGPENIEDIIQKVFLNLHRARHQYRAGEVFDAWFFSILRNVWIDELRKSEHAPTGKTAIPIEEAPESSPALQVSQPQAVEASVPLEQLPGHHREALELRYQQGLEFGGMARKWNVTEAVARKRVSRAIGALRELLGIKASGGES